METKTDTRRTRMFRNGKYNTAIRFPAEWEIEPTDAEISYDGNTITVRPLASLEHVFEQISQRPTQHPFIEPDDLPAEPVDL